MTALAWLLALVAAWSALATIGVLAWRCWRLERERWRLQVRNGVLRVEFTRMERALAVAERRQAASESRGPIVDWIEAEADI